MRREELYLTDISEAAEAMASFLSGVARADFLQDDLRRSAVLHKLTIIGEAAARLPEDFRDHPHICAVYEVGEEAGYSFIVMQCVEGETLASRIQRQSLDIRAALDIAVQIADALAEAHSHRIIHRDVKPQNFVLTASGQVKVLDFGLARVVREGSLIGGESGRWGPPNRFNGFVDLAVNNTVETVPIAVNGFGTQLKLGVNEVGRRDFSHGFLEGMHDSH